MCGKRADIILLLICMALQHGRIHATGDWEACYNTGANDTEYCFVLSNLTASWDEADAGCRTDRGILATICAPEQQAIIRTFLLSANQTEPVWVAGKSEDPQKVSGNFASLWRWVEGIGKREGCASGSAADSVQERATDQQGCYVQSVSAPDLEEVDRGSHVFPQQCIEKCISENKGYMYAGIHIADPNDQVCTCGTWFGTLGNGPVDQCITRCSNGPAGSICGGLYKKNVYKIGGNFSAWGYDQPRPDSDDQFCAALNPDPHVNPAWRMESEQCWKLHPFICDMPGSVCVDKPDDNRYMNTSYGACIFISNQSDADTWHRAREQCRLSEGDLLRLQSQTELDEIKTICERIGFQPDYIFIGLYKNAVVWKRMYSEVEMFYANYGPDQPDYSVGDYISIEPSEDFQWALRPTTDRKQYLCYSGPGLETTTVPATTTETTTTTTGRGDPVSTTTVHLVPSTTSDSVSTTSSSTISMPPSPPSTQAPLARGHPPADIAIYTLVAVFGVAVIVLIIILLYLRKKNKSKVTVHPDGDKFDGRVDSTVPQCGPIGEVQADYDLYTDMGSRAYLLDDDIAVEVPTKKGVRPPFSTAYPAEVGNALSKSREKMVDSVSPSREQLEAPKRPASPSRSKEQIQDIKTPD